MPNFVTYLIFFPFLISIVISTFSSSDDDDDVFDWIVFTFVTAMQYNIGWGLKFQKLKFVMKIYPWKEMCMLEVGHFLLCLMLPSILWRYYLFLIYIVKLYLIFTFQSVISLMILLLCLHCRVFLDCFVLHHPRKERFRFSKMLVELLNHQGT